jgi:hypothetical protein
MCLPIAALGLTAAQTLMAGLTVATTAASVIGQRQSAKAQQAAIRKQSEVQNDQIAKAAGQELTQQARAARRERATMRATASESGINLESGSFLAALQTSSLNQFNNQGLIVQNAAGQQAGRAASTQSLLNQSKPMSALNAGLTIGSSAVGAYGEAKDAAMRGSTSATGG